MRIRNITTMTLVAVLGLLLSTAIVAAAEEMILMSEEWAVEACEAWNEDELQPKADYLMFAQTTRWEEMGAGKYGPMKGMMFRRLRFQGPKMEAMNNMGPFKNFLLLTGEIPSDTSTCPAS